MKKITSYILSQLFFATTVVILVLSTIVWLVQSLRYVELIANKDVPIALFLKMLLFLFPNIFVITIPIAVLLGTLFIYNKLTTDHELVVMQAAGLSPAQLARPAFLLGITLTVFLYAITVYFLPYSFRKHRDTLLLLKQESLASLISEGQFSTFKQYTVYAHKQNTPNQFSGVLLYDGSNPNTSVIFTAEQGTLVNKKGGGYLLLTHGSRQEQAADTNKLSILYFDRYVIDPTKKNFDPHHDARFVKTYERTTTELLCEKDPTLKNEFIKAAHQRLISPLYVLLFSLMGAITLLTGYFNRQGRAKRIMFACIGAVLMKGLEMILFHTNSGGTFIVVLCYILVLIPIAICLYLLSPLRNRT